MQSAEELINSLEETKGLSCLTMDQKINLVCARDKEIVEIISDSIIKLPWPNENPSERRVEDIRTALDSIFRELS